ncbi:double-strand break repair protein AddB [Roseovarius sp. EL26]|uniref:double-strand break repair protein AddB n=1 Tax=Roseovarius sp. EL26 TaxID=2126672 RepID=UPI000EA24FAB|nr:double-strand break repair protein AddB [Roseovarius sp. EL26]
MFDALDHPRVYGVSLGSDFPKALVNGLVARTANLPPDALARCHLVVNTRRMARRVRALFDQGPPCLLPKISLISQLPDTYFPSQIPPAAPPLRRRLEVAQLITRLLESDPSIASRASVYDLADQLVALMDEMQGEGVSPDMIDALDVSDQSGHWRRIKSFLGIVSPYFESNQNEPDPEARQRRAIEQLIESWHASPPDHPVIVAGSTGSRGATQILMQAVAKLPQGAIILPGFDLDMPGAVWDRLMPNNSDGLPLEDHPQYRFADLMEKLGLQFDDVPHWHQAPPANPNRNKVLSLALRPAPVTDQWLIDGPNLPDLPAAMQDVTLLNAASQRHEAMAIALRLRQAAQDGTTAALITPDRNLTRQVSAALDRWNITPDDSAGMPLHRSAPGRFLRHVGDLLRQPLTAELLLTLLKHPLCHAGQGRGPHLRLTRELELHLRRKAAPYPDEETLHNWAEGCGIEGAKDWIVWLCYCLIGQNNAADQPMSDLIVHHIDLAERLSGGIDPDDAPALWSGDAGKAAHQVMQELVEAAPAASVLNTFDYINIFSAVLARKEVRNPITPNPNILIWGTLEARVQGVELLILAGLNEGSWPESPSPDPWLNRALRHQAGLLLPERRTGLSAHDFQQAACAPEVWFTRSLRSNDSETITSRWVNRLQNLLSGLPDQGGPEALQQMQARGQLWLDRVQALENPTPIDPAPRPAPCPPPSARPKRLSVTEIRHLIRDPYAIYAKHILNLRPLDPLMRGPDPAIRGTVLHKVLEKFIRATLDHSETLTKSHLLQLTQDILATDVPWAEARTLWLARMEQIADWFIETEQVRRTVARPTAFEARGSASCTDPEFSLNGTADRIDMDETGAVHVYDYKTGTPPTKDQQVHFDKQLLLEAAIAQQSGFGNLAPAHVARAVYIGLASGGKEVDAPLLDEPPEVTWDKLKMLISAYSETETGYTARRAMHLKRDYGNYDQLARFGEWDITDDPDKSRVG